MKTIEISKEISGKKFTYSAFCEGEKLGTITGAIQNPQILWLANYEAFNKDKEPLYLKELQQRFYSDCLQNKSKILINVVAKREKAIWFMNTSAFKKYIHYVFEHDLNEIARPINDLGLLSFKDVPLPEYQKIFYESTKGDPKENLENVTAKAYFDQEKIDLEDCYDEDLMYLATANNETIGVLNLRVMLDEATGTKEGAINYIGLIEKARRKGYGKDLHLMALKKLQALGCSLYFGGTDSRNTGMLKIFEKNNCKRAETQYQYKAENV